MFLSVLPASHLYHIFHTFYNVQSVVATTYILIFFYPSSLELFHTCLYLVWKMAELGPVLCVMLDKMHLSQSEPLIFRVYCIAPRACSALFATTYIQVTVKLRTLYCCLPTPHIGDTIMNK